MYAHSSTMPGFRMPVPFGARCCRESESVIPNYNRHNL